MTIEVILVWVALLVFPSELLSVAGEGLLLILADAACMARVQSIVTGDS